MPAATAADLPPLRDTDGFLAWLERQDERYELAGGRLVLMAGGSAAHNDIQVNLLTALRTRLRGGPCRPNGPDLLLKLDDRTGRFPDASVTCGERGERFVTDPVVLFEILSESTEARDRGEKRREYQRLPSLRHYVLIDQATPRVEVYSRDKGVLADRLSIGLRRSRFAGKAQRRRRCGSIAEPMQRSGRAGSGAKTVGNGLASTPANGRWLFQELEGAAALLPLDALGVALPLAELYDGVALPPPGIEPQRP